MTKPVVPVWASGKTLTPLTPEQIEKGYAYTADKTGPDAGLVVSNDLDNPLKDLTTAVAYVLNRMQSNGVINGMPYVDATAYVKGNIVVGVDGHEYYCNKVVTGVSPVGDTGDNWRRYPFIETVVNNFVITKYFDGSMIITGDNFSIPANTELTELSITFPVAFTSKPVIAGNIQGGLSAADGGSSQWGYESITNTGTILRYSISLPLSASDGSFGFIAKGKWA